MIDENGNRIRIGTTDAEGGIDIPAAHAGREVVVDLNGAVDLFTGETFGAAIEYMIDLPDQANGQILVASPISTAIELLINAENNDIDTVAQAIDQIFGEGYEIDRTR